MLAWTVSVHFFLRRFISSSSGENKVMLSPLILCVQLSKLTENSSDFQVLSQSAQFSQFGFMSQFFSSYSLAQNLKNSKASVIFIQAAFHFFSSSVISKPYSLHELRQAKKDV